VPSGQTEAGITVAYHPYGISLDFTPLVMDDGKINLHIATDVSEVGANGVFIGGTGVGITAAQFIEKKTETDVNLPSGGQIMVSGLLKDEVTDAVTGTPGLKDVPILGTLFRSTEFQRHETELVFLVTAYLAKPIEGEKGAISPTDGFESPTDIDLYFLGRLHREYTAKEDVPAWRLPFKIEGPFGYMMEKIP
jgi:pilus assembly protein CpaC